MPFHRLWPMLRALRSELEREIPRGALSSPEREARLFAETLARIPVGSTGTCGIAGEMGMEFVGEAERAGWEQRIAACEAAHPPAAPGPFEQAQSLGFQASDGGRAHTTIDYGLAVTQGLKGVCARIDRESPAEESRRQTLRAMRAALQALAGFARHYASRHPLCARVPWEPAQSFEEGLQTLWLLHIGIAVSEQAPWSISLGRFDQYLLALYRADRTRGIPEATLEAQLADFFAMLDHPEFADAAVNLNLGGTDRAGRSQFNELSRLVVKVAARSPRPAPILAARIDDRTAPEDLDRLCVPELLAIGQPTFYGEEPCRRALAARGVAPDAIPDWAANSCMGLMLPGQEWQDMWGSVINLLVPLELALNEGRPFRGTLALPLQTRPPARYATFDELFETVCAYTDELVGLFIAETERRRALRGRDSPNPFVSALLDDCIGRGLDRLAGGVRYRTLIVEAFGLVNCADALLAIRTLAFETQEYTLGTLAAVARSDFAGADELLHRVRSLPKYGNADREADALAAGLAARFAQSVSRRSGAGLACAPSFHTLNAHVDKGAQTAASLDGRRAGEPLAKNIGTRPGLAANGHTSLILSATAIDQSQFHGGQALDLWLDPILFRTAEGRRRFQALLKAYFQRGGLQVQVNGLSPETLRKAMAEPGQHRDLMVRIGGFTLRFADMPAAAQRDFIARFETGV